MATTAAGNHIFLATVSNPYQPDHFLSRALRGFFVSDCLTARCFSRDESGTVIRRKITKSNINQNKRS
jgi:hypothetical protein